MAENVGAIGALGTRAAERSRYGEARFVVGFLTLLGSLLVLGGLLFFLVAIMAGTDNPGALFGILPSLGAAFAGLLIVANCQMLKAGLDTADNTREILALLRAERS